MSGPSGNAGCPCADPLLTTSHAMTTCTAEETASKNADDSVVLDCCNSNAGGNANHIRWGSCLSALVSEGNIQPYPPTYGSQCMKHDEVGNEDCFSQSSGNEHGVGNRRDPVCTADPPTTGCPVIDADLREVWCDNFWCYVDPCVCNAAVSQSEYFLGQSISYSYDTCGSADLFAATVTGGTQQAVCTAGANDSWAHQQSPALTTVIFLVALTMGRMLPKL